MSSRLRRSLIALVFFAPFLTTSARADDDFEHAPIAYSKTKPNTHIDSLQKKIDAGRVELAFSGEKGYLPAVLDALGIEKSSQVLVFSKTSMQRHRIGPWAPRAIYFDDDATSAIAGRARCSR